MGPVCVTCVMYVLVRGQSLGFVFSDYLIEIIKAGLIQSTLALLAFGIPEVKSFFVSVMYNNTGNVVLENNYALWRRFYGFSNSMLDSYGIGTGMIAALPLYLVAFDKNRKAWLIAMPFLLMVPILNSRTGIVIFLLYVLFFFLYLMSKSPSHLLTIPLIAGVCAAALFMLIWIISQIAPTTASWITLDLTTFLNGDGSITGKTLFSVGFWTLPQDIFLLVGTGHTVYGLSGFSHSDVGYVNDLWRTGIIGIILLYFTMLFVIRKAVRSTPEKVFKFLIAGLGVSIFVFQIKAQAFTYTGGMAIFQLLCFASIFQGNEGKERRLSR